MGFDIYGNWDGTGDAGGYDPNAGSTDTTTTDNTPTYSYDYSGITEIPNNTQPGQEGYGWKYYSDGTVISPTGQYYSTSSDTGATQLVYDPSNSSKGAWGSLLGTLGTSAANAIKAMFTDPKTGSVNWGNVAAAAGAILGGTGIFSNKSNQQKTGYQGGIPNLAAVREQVQGTYDPNRRAGSGGQRYFTDTKFVSPTEQATAQAAAKQEAEGLAALNKANPANEEKQVAANQSTENLAGGGLATIRPNSTLVSQNYNQLAGASKVPPSFPTTQKTAAPVNATPQNIWAQRIMANVAKQQAANKTTPTTGGISTLPATPVAPTPVAPTPVAPTPATPVNPTPDLNNMSEAQLMEILNTIPNNPFAPGSGAPSKTAPAGATNVNYDANGYVSSYTPGPQAPWTDLQNQAAQMYQSKYMAPPAFAVGGVAALSRESEALPTPGLKQGTYLAGTTDGMADKIPANIDGKQEARLSHGEFVIPADVVSHLGNGNSDSGAQRLYAMMDKVRKARTGTKKQGKQINPDKYLMA